MKVLYRGNIHLHRRRQAAASTNQDEIVPCESELNVCAALAEETKKTNGFVHNTEQW